MGVRPRGDVTSHTDEAGRTTRYVYDAAGNLASETDAAGHDTRYTSTPSGQVASRTDALGRTWALHLRRAWPRHGRGPARWDDDAVRVHPRRRPLGGDRAVGGEDPYEYDARGNLTTLIDPLGHRTTYGYDASNRLTAVTDPLGAVTTWEWDAGDRIVATVDPTGARTTFTYDRKRQPDLGDGCHRCRDPVRVGRPAAMVKTIAADGGETRYA